VNNALIGNPITLVNDINGFPREIHAGVMLVIGGAIRHAWATICNDPGKHLVDQAPGAPEEDRYTEAICQILDQMLSAETPVIEGFTSDIFQSVSRSESSSNFSGQNLNKQPDILIRFADAPLVQARRFIGIYIEAKVVSLSRHISKYTKDGVKRFVDGEYSWAMRDGLMLAYQKVKHRPNSTLAKELKKDTDLSCVEQEPGVYLKEGVPGSGIDISCHMRSWEYVGGGTPGNVRVWHIWDLNIP